MSEADDLNRAFHRRKRLGKSHDEQRHRGGVRNEGEGWRCGNRWVELDGCNGDDGKVSVRVMRLGMDDGFC